MRECKILSFHSDNAVKSSWAINSEHVFVITSVHHHVCHNFLECYYCLCGRLRQLILLDFVGLILIMVSVTVTSCI
jgi:hypothetical protein